MPMPTAVLLYDGQCPICLRARDWLAARIPAATLRMIPCQGTERAALAPQVAEADCLAAMHLVLPEGRVLAGEQAFPALLRMMPGYGPLAVLLGLPGPRHLAPHAYRWVARNRFLLSGLFRRKADGAACPRDGDCG
jgi:predicted DCC family thiol-disulfide oxidoreductase YuxK